MKQATFFILISLILSLFGLPVDAELVELSNPDGSYHLVDYNEDRSINACYYVYALPRFRVDSSFFDEKGRLEVTVEGLALPNERKTYYSYDAAGRLSKIQKANGVELNRVYNEENDLVEYFSGDRSLHYQIRYDDQRRPIAISDQNGSTTQREYDNQGRVVLEKLGNQLEMRYAYNDQGHRTAVYLPDGSSILYEYESENLKSITKLDKNQQKLYQHVYNTYNQDGKPLSCQMIGKAGEINFAYDKRGRYQRIAAKHWTQSIPEEGYDSEGNLKNFSITDVEGEQHFTFAYDEENRLLWEAHQKLQIDAMDEVLSSEETNYNYDLNGNRVLKQGPNGSVIYVYDPLDRLICIEDPQIGTIRYTYDFFDRRLSKTIIQGEESKTIRFLYDGKKEIGSVDEKGRILELRVLGIGLGADVGASVALELDEKIFAPIHDHRGNMTCLIEAETGNVKEFYRFDPYGVEQQFAVEGSILNPWRFSSKRYDQESGLIYYGKRYYDPEIGKWTTLDPAGTLDGLDRYAFLKDNPLSHIDLYGLFSLKNGLKNLFQKGKEYYNSAIQFASDINNFIENDLCYTRYIRNGMDNFYEKVFGKRFLEFAGYYSSQPVYGSCGEDELDEKIKITFINGILNVRDQFLRNIQFISDTHGGNKVHFVFRPTEGWTADVFNCFFIKMGVVSPPARLLAETWKRLIEEMGGPDGGGKIIHYAHSIGATDTYVAKNLLTPEEQKLIHVVTLGSPTIIPNEGFGEVSNYVSLRDGVCLLDPLGFFSGFFDEDSNVVYLGSLQGIPIIDHPLFMQTYIDAIHMLGKKFLDMMQIDFTESNIFSSDIESP